MSTIFPAMRFHGCINDCLYVTDVPYRQIEYALEHDCKPEDVVPAQKAYHLFWPDGSPRFKVKVPLLKRRAFKRTRSRKNKTTIPKDDFVYTAAPKLEWSNMHNRPRPSAWRARNTEPIEDDDRAAFGYWSTNGPFKGEGAWKFLDEPEEIGRGSEDTFQNEAADAIVQNRGGYVDGRGGTGKSFLIKLLVEKFEADGVL